LPAVIGQMKRRLGRAAPPNQAVELWSAAYILMGLRYEQTLVQKAAAGRGYREGVTIRLTFRPSPQKTKGDIREG
jgi:hypothetical protein